MLIPDLPDQSEPGQEIHLQWPMRSELTYRHLDDTGFFDTGFFAPAGFFAPGRMKQLVHIGVPGSCHSGGGNGSWCPDDTL
ncbi:MAG: hypothetical protein VKJ44_06955 [Synechococcus sp.]|nr:hypothetical protein [Synechococcus sp.]